MATTIRAYSGTMPNRTQDTATFNTNVDAWFAYLTGNHKTDINTISSEVETNTTNAENSATAAANSANEAATSSASSVAAANYQGRWSTLTGALNIPASAEHDGYVWTLLENLADVTAEEPGVSTKWLATSTNELTLATSTLYAYYNLG